MAWVQPERNAGGSKSDRRARSARTVRGAVVLDGPRRPPGTSIRSFGGHGLDRFFLVRVPCPLRLGQGTERIEVGEIRLLSVIDPEADLVVAEALERLPQGAHAADALAADLLE